MPISCGDSLKQPHETEREKVHLENKWGGMVSIMTSSLMWRLKLHNDHDLCIAASSFNIKSKFRHDQRSCSAF